MTCTSCGGSRFASHPMWYGGPYCLDCGHPVAARTGSRWKEHRTPEDRRNRRIQRWFVWVLGIGLPLFGIGYLLKTLGVIR